jgi:hypothetical protein
MSLNLVIAVLVNTILCSSLRVPQDSWTVNGETNAVSLSSVQQDGTFTVFTFTNVSGKSITGFAICFGTNHRTQSLPLTPSQFTHYFDWFDRTPAFDDGAAQTLKIDNRDTALHSRIVDISAVIFEDGTAQGWVPHIETMTYDRIGKTAEIERIKNILNERSIQYVGSQGLTSLAAKVSSLPDSVDAALASLGSVNLPGVSLLEVVQGKNHIRAAFLSGVRAAREDMQRTIIALRRLPITSTDPLAVTQTTQLLNLRDSYNAKSAAHQTFLKHISGGKIR